MRRFRRQISALTRKNLLLVKRRRMLALFELLMPLLLVVLLGLVDLAFTTEAPRLATLETLTSDPSTPPPIRCQVFDSEYGSFGYGQPLPEDRWCVPLVFAPLLHGGALAVMREVASRNGYSAPASFRDQLFSQPQNIRSPAALRKSIIGFDSIDEMKSWLREHQGRVALGVVFGESTVASGVAMPPPPPPPRWRPKETAAAAAGLASTEAADEWHSMTYELWYNRSCIVNGWYAAAGADPVRAQSGRGALTALQRGTSSADGLVDSSLLLSAQRMVDDAVLGVVAQRAGLKGEDARLELTLRIYPRVRASEGQTLSSSFGSLFVLMGLTLPMLATVVRVASEKENHVAGAMRSIGVAPTAYWLSYWAQSLCHAVLSSVLVYLGGLACRVPLFVRSDGSILLLVCIGYLLNLSSLAFLLCSLTHQV